MKIIHYKGTVEEIEALHRKIKGRLRSAKVLMQIGEFDNSISRSYYAILDSARVLLLSEGCFAKTHDGVITLFSLRFVKTKKVAPKYIRIFKEIEKIGLRRIINF